MINGISIPPLGLSFLFLNKYFMVSYKIELKIIYRYINLLLNFINGWIMCISEKNYSKTPKSFPPLYINSKNFKIFFSVRNIIFIISLSRFYYMLINVYKLPIISTCIKWHDGNLVPCHHFFHHVSMTYQRINYHIIRYLLSQQVRYRDWWIWFNVVTDSNKYDIIWYFETYST